MRALLAMCAVALLSSACGPLLSTYLILGAQADLEGAQAAEAKLYAVYEYTAASEYLHKAREEQGFADFGPSIDFAYKARDLAHQATVRAQDEKRKMLEAPRAEWEVPEREGQMPSVIIKKKIVPIPREDAPGPR